MHSFARPSASSRRSRSCWQRARARTSTWDAAYRKTRSSRRPGLGAGGARLSAGQKQLIAVARALAGHPRILFLDEATSRIDSETEQEVQAALAELRGRTTVIAIAHRLSTIRAADRIFVLNHGRVAEQGTHE